MKLNWQSNLLISLLTLFFILNCPAQTNTLAGKKITKLPRPTGDYPVGTRVFKWTDETREEKATPDPKDKRQVIVQIWYPAEKGSAKPARYVPQLNAYRNVWDEETFDLLAGVRTDILDSPAVSKRKKEYPVFIFSHGWQSNRSLHTILLSEIASHGYIVVGIDHPFLGRTVLKNQRKVTEPTEDHFKSFDEAARFYGRDVIFVIDKLDDMNSYIRHRMGKAYWRMDLRRLAVAGHSSGFTAALSACSADMRIQACANFDAPGISAERLLKIRQPLLWIGTEKAGGPPAEFMENVKTPVKKVQIKNANHGSFQDWDFLEAKTGPERQKALSNSRQISEEIIGFLNRYVK